MPMIPAVCSKCGSIMNSGIYLENSTNVTMAGNKVSPCPVCGGVGEVIDGVYSTIDDLIEIIPFDNSHKLLNLKLALENLDLRNSTTEDVEEVFNEQGIDYKKLMRYLQTIFNDNQGIIAFISLIIGIINLSLATTVDTTNVNIQIENTIETNIDYERIINEQQKYIEKYIDEE